MVRAQDPGQVGQQLPEQPQRRPGITPMAGPGGDVAAGGQDVEMVGVLQAASVGEFFGGMLKRVRVAAKVAVAQS